MRIADPISVGADSISARNKAICSAFVPACSFHHFVVPLPPGGRHERMFSSSTAKEMAGGASPSPTENRLFPALSVSRSMRIADPISVGADSIYGRNNGLSSAFVPAGSFHRFAVPLPSRREAIRPSPAERPCSQRAVANVKTIRDSPVVSKRSYLRKGSLAKRCCRTCIATCATAPLLTAPRQETGGCGGSADAQTVRRGRPLRQ